MANDGVDYTIVFPDALVSDTLAGNKITSCHTAGMGWMQRQTSCQVQGCVTICYTAALKTVFFSESFGYKELRNTALKLLEILYDYEVENSPICFHVFSNGGFMLYRYIVELLHSHKQFSTLCRVGAVVDSAPGTRNVREALRALTATL